MISAATDGTGVPTIDNVEDERGVNADGGVQTLRRLPGAESNASDVFAMNTRGVKREGASVASDEMTGIDHAAHFNLEAVEGGIDVAHGAAGSALFAQDVPGFESLTDFEVDAALGDAAVNRKAKFHVGS